MRGDPKTMQVLRPRSAAEAVRNFGAKPKAVPLAGGTDFMVLWNIGLKDGRTILDLSAVREWKRFQKTKNALVAGAMVTHTELQEHPLVQREFPLLVQACSLIGAAAIQNRGTLGGNIANASPAGDTFPPLAVYEPAVRLVSPKGARSIPFLEIFAGVKRTTLGPSELIESIELPFLKRRPSRQMFRKVGTRAAQALSKVAAAGLLWLDKQGRVEELRFALGSVAPTVRRLKTAEASVKGKALTPDVIEEACRLVADDISPIDDVRSTAWYRLSVSRNLFRSFLEDTHA